MSSSTNISNIINKMSNFKIIPNYKNRNYFKIEFITITNYPCYFAERNLPPIKDKLFGCYCTKHVNQQGIRNIEISTLDETWENVLINPLLKFCKYIFETIRYYNMIVDNKKCSDSMLQVYYNKIQKIINDYFINLVDYPDWGSPNYNEEYKIYDSKRIQILWDFLEEIDIYIPSKYSLFRNE